MHFMKDLHHNIWVGTSQGLKQLNPQTQKVRKYTISDGLPSNSISAIEGDANGNLWISTNFGISRFNPSTQTFVNFYASDGLQGNEFSKGVSFASTKGEIIFGSTSGITYFNPGEITSPNKKPEIRITDFYVHDKAVRSGHEIRTLRYCHNLCNEFRQISSVAQRQLIQHRALCHGVLQS